MNRTFLKIADKIIQLHFLSSSELCERANNMLYVVHKEQVTKCLCVVHREQVKRNEEMATNRTKCENVQETTKCVSEKRQSACARECARNDTERVRETTKCVRMRDERRSATTKCEKRHARNKVGLGCK